VWWGGGAAVWGVHEGQVLRQGVPEGALEAAQGAVQAAAEGGGWCEGLRKHTYAPAALGSLVRKA
jgi:hypothetical protein